MTDGSLPPTGEGSRGSSSAERDALRQRPKGWPVLHMRWEKLLFLHWRWDVKDLQRRLPAELVVDTFQGAAWLGIVPFFMRRVHPTGLLAIPWLSDFLELNVRTYVTDRHGRPGVWFFSLACNQPIAVELARRTFGLNYVQATMSAPIDNSGWCYYHSQRKGAAASHIEYRPAFSGDPAQIDTLEHFLVERYVLYSRSPTGHLLSGRVHHPAYQITQAEVRACDFSAALADGFPDPGRAPDYMHTSLDQAVEAWSVERVA